MATDHDDTDHDDTDLLELRVSPELVQLEMERRAQAAKPWQRICTIVPRYWEARLQKTVQVSAYRLALELLYQHWRNGGQPVPVSNALAEAAGLSPRTKSRALNTLTRLGLVQVHRQKRRGTARDPAPRRGPPARASGGPLSSPTL
jgi:DNA-binding transcriptional ArsR family regulator